MKRTGLFGINKINKNNKGRKSLNWGWFGVFNGIIPKKDKRHTKLKIDLEWKIFFS